MIDWLRDCLRLQEVLRHCPVNFTLFGRAKLLTGEHPIYSEQPSHYMAYWVRLPLMQMRYAPHSDRECLHRGVLAWHGKRVKLVWIPVEELP